MLEKILSPILVDYYFLNLVHLFDSRIHLVCFTFDPETLYNNQAANSILPRESPLASLLVEKEKKNAPEEVLLQIVQNMAIVVRPPNFLVCKAGQSNSNIDPNTSLRKFKISTINISIGSEYGGEIFNKGECFTTFESLSILGASLFQCPGLNSRSKSKSTKA